MIVTREMLDSEEFAPLFIHCKNTKAAKEEILKILGKEPGGRYTYSEQDNREQMRTIIQKYEYHQCGACPVSYGLPNLICRLMNCFLPAVLRRQKCG